MYCLLQCLFHVKNLSDCRWSNFAAGTFHQGRKREREKRERRGQGKREKREGRERKRKREGREREKGEGEKGEGREEKKNRHGRPFPPAAGQTLLRAVCIFVLWKFARGERVSLRWLHVLVIRMVNAAANANHDEKHNVCPLYYTRAHSQCTFSCISAHLQGLDARQHVAKAHKSSTCTGKHIKTRAVIAGKVERKKHSSAHTHLQGTTP